MNFYLLNFLYKAIIYNQENFVFFTIKVGLFDFFLLMPCVLYFSGLTDLFLVLKFPWPNFNLTISSIIPFTFDMVFHISKWLYHCRALQTLNQPNQTKKHEITRQNKGHLGQCGLIDQV